MFFSVLLTVALTLGFLTPHAVCWLQHQAHCMHFCTHTSSSARLDGCLSSRLCVSISGSPSPHNSHTPGVTLRCTPMIVLCCPAFQVQSIIFTFVFMHLFVPMFIPIAPPMLAASQHALTFVFLHELFGSIILFKCLGVALVPVGLHGLCYPGILS